MLTLVKEFFDKQFSPCMLHCMPLERSPVAIERSPCGGIVAIEYAAHAPIEQAPLAASLERSPLVAAFHRSPLAQPLARHQRVRQHAAPERTHLLPGLSGRTQRTVGIPRRALRLPELPSRTQQLPQQSPVGGAQLPGGIRMEARVAPRRRALPAYGGGRDIPVRLLPSIPAAEGATRGADSSVLQPAG